MILASLCPNFRWTFEKSQNKVKINGDSFVLNVQEAQSIIQQKTSFIS